MRAVLDFDAQAAGEEIAPVILANRSAQIHLPCSRRHQAWRQSERRHLLRRLRSVIIDLGRDRPLLHDRV
jgi:hypothetical protein